MVAAPAAYTPPNSLPRLNGLLERVSKPTLTSSPERVQVRLSPVLLFLTSLCQISSNSLKLRPPIYSKGRWYRIPLFLSKYPSEKLAQIIAAHLPATPLGEIATPLMITSSEIAKSEVHIFRSNYGSRDSEIAPTDKDVGLRDAILASCAAPTFFAPKSVDNLLLADGGLWANNPSTVAFTEALSAFGKEAREIRMLSIGTGHSVNMYRNRRGWGFITGWGGAKLTSYVMTLQSQASANMAKLLLKENYLRINPEIDFWELDTLTQLDTLKSLAERDFERHAAEIEAFISATSE